MSKNNLFKSESELYLKNLIKIEWNPVCPYINIIEPKFSSAVNAHF